MTVYTWPVKESEPRVRFRRSLTVTDFVATMDTPLAPLNFADTLPTSRAAQFASVSRSFVIVPTTDTSHVSPAGISIFAKVGVSLFDAVPETGVASTSAPPSLPMISLVIAIPALL